MLPGIENFCRLDGGKESHENEMMFWDQCQNRFHKIAKILSHQDHYYKTLDFQSFQLDFEFL
jgi:hypothetical protein